MFLMVSNYIIVMCLPCDLKSRGHTSEFCFVELGEEFRLIAIIIEPYFSSQDNYTEFHCQRNFIFFLSHLNM